MGIQMGIATFLHPRSVRVPCPAIVMTLLATWFLSGCSETSTPSSDEPTEIRLQLNWYADAQHGGFYSALAEGEYAKEGLNVTILQGGPGSPVLPKLVMGRVEFAVASADQILQAREQDADVIGVFAPIQHSPRCIMVHADSDIMELKELEDLTLGMNEGRTFAMFLKSRLPLTGVQIVPYGGSIARFLNDPDFAQQAFLFSEPIVAKNAGAHPRALMVSDLGFDPYTSVVVARSSMCQEQSGLVEKFVRATRRGWGAYLADPSTGDTLIQQANKNMDQKSLTQAAQAIRPLCDPESGEIGMMNAGRWRELATAMHSVGALSSDPKTAANAAWRNF